MHVVRLTSAYVLKVTLVRYHSIYMGQGLSLHIYSKLLLSVATIYISLGHIWSKGRWLATATRAAVDRWVISPLAEAGYISEVSPPPKEPSLRAELSMYLISHPLLFLCRRLEIPYHYYLYFRFFEGD